MRFARLYLAFALVLVVSCEQPAATDEAPTISEEEKPIEKFADLEEESQKEPHQEDAQDADNLDVANVKFDPAGLENPSILPPIILLDFANDLDNSTSGDEKSKRTIDGSLGYGFGRNNFFTGKYNYYFPAGKSGTTVSIEESISPFQPKTIIETVKPISEKPFAGDIGSNSYGQNPLQKNNNINNFQSTSGLAGNNNRPTQQTATINNNNNRYVVGAQPIFGQRTKLYKPSQIDYSGFTGFSSTPKSTYGVSQNSFATSKPALQAGSFSSGFSQSVSHTSARPYAGFSTPAPPPAYVTPTSTSYQTRFPSNSANSYSTPRPSFDGITTARPADNSQSYSSLRDSPLASFSNLPRYTIENGVRYENKIVWKYPDGKISQTPPSSYLNAYNEFLTKQKPGVGGPSYQSAGSSTGSYQSQATYSNQNQNYQSQLVRYQNSQASRYPQAESVGNIYSKSPALFPKDQEQPGKPARPSQFVSSASLLSSANYVKQQQQAFQGQASYGYQGQFGLKNPPRSGVASASGYQGLHSTKSTYEDLRPVSKYAVNSPNPEYTFSTEPSVKSSGSSSTSSLFTPTGTLSPTVLSKYSPQAQKYLTKVFSSGTTASTPTGSYGAGASSIGSYGAGAASIGSYSAGAASIGSYSAGASSPPQVNTNYESLLNYNPSISQYIRNPSSILNAQPTYIQAGNSLIPVIILRVDGAPPIQPKATPNINLKALLQQYLTQYAGSVGQAASYQQQAGEYGKAPSAAAATAAPQSPLYELTQLAQSLTQYSQDPSAADNFAKQFEGTLTRSPYETLNSYVPPRSSYEHEAEKGVEADGLGKYGARTGNKPQKVKSVQIIEDPRFTSYKVNS